MHGGHGACGIRALHWPLAVLDVQNVTPGLPGQGEAGQGVAVSSGGPPPAGKTAQAAAAARMEAESTLLASPLAPYLVTS